jgi:hypothetical protein
LLEFIPGTDLVSLCSASWNRMYSPVELNNVLCFHCHIQLL